MKLTRKAISVALALIMVVSALAVSTVTSFADESDYDGNILASYDQYINDYAYGTGLSATWPRQLTFNKDGWMRIQSYEKGETPDADGNYLNGHFEYQWQYHGFATPEYNDQFHAAVKATENNDYSFYLYMYVKSASTKNKDLTKVNNLKDYVELEVVFNVRVDTNRDGKFDDKDTLVTLHESRLRSITNTNYGFRYYSAELSSQDILDTVAEGNYDYKLEDFLVNVQNYDNPMGNLDVFISPFFTTALPGFEEAYPVNGSFNKNIRLFNAEEAIDVSSFTENADGLDTSKWTWDVSKLETEQDKQRAKYPDLGDIKRDEDNYPLDASGNRYTPMPAGAKQANLPKVSCTNLKATNVTDTTVTLTWDIDGDANTVNYYHISDADNGINIKDAKTTTYTVKGLTAGKTYNFKVRSKNRSGIYSGYSSVVTVKTTGGSVTPATTTTTKPTVAPTTKPTPKPTVAPTMNTKAKPAIKLVKAKKAITLKLTKKVANAQGYEVQYSLKKNFKGAKKLTLKATAKSKKISKLKAKKKYYVRVRAFGKVNGKKVYTKWVVKNVKTK